ncbi:hypothetical protein [Hymenobacter guriensis]|uniref:T9SS type A sorting domain-containing protein n=1 Tax=Hymenobacter guriensis TaxID=2793065 RepID=A0ABS0L103_9BACT|nr:hypothetical protein [Hymenobacter guriensis]MBG8553794.1 hypothetical protein [Hymenobacter guriensis]
MVTNAPAAESISLMASVQLELLDAEGNILHSVVGRQQLLRHSNNVQYKMAGQLYMLVLEGAVFDALQRLKEQTQPE